MVDGSWTYSLIPKIPVGTCSSFKPWLGLWEICTGSREFDQKYRGVLRICPWTNSVIWMDLEWSGYISAQRDVSLFFFRCSWVSLIFSSSSKPSEKESMVLSWKSGMTSGWNGAFLHCNRMFNYKPSILGYLRYLHLSKPPPNLLKHSTTLLEVSEEGGGTSAAYHFLEKAEGQKFRFQALQFAASRFVMVCLGNYPKVTSPFKFIYPQYIHILSACSRKVVRRATWLPRCIRYPNPSANLPKSGQHVAIPPRL